MREITYMEAIREAIQDEMEQDRSVFLLGEDIGVYGGAFGVTRGLLERFGPERVINTPISEQSFVGLAIGASLAGSRPIVEIMFMDFITLCMDQLINCAAKLRYVFGPQARCPLVIRTAAGGGKSYGPTHSQCLEALFLHVPGLKVVAPATAADAKGLLRASIRDDNPVIFVEHKRLYARRESIVESDGMTPIGKARVAMEGHDVTIIAHSWMVVEAERAAASLLAEGIHAELVDLRTLAPLDTETIVKSVRKTGKVVIVEEGCRTGGLSAELGFRIFEHAYDFLDAPITRVTTPDIPIPSSASLERAAIPDSGRIARAVRELVRKGKSP